MSLKCKLCENSIFSLSEIGHASYFDIGILADYCFYSEYSGVRRNKFMVTIAENILAEIENAEQVIRLIKQDDSLLADVRVVTEICVAAYKNGGKLIFAGNGGSAADAQHMAAELVGRFEYDRPGMASIALTTDTSMLTSISNDYGFEHVFARQLEANGNAGDIFFGLTTSGSSKNILHAIDVCKAKNITTVGLTGTQGNNLTAICDYCFIVPSNVTARIQEAHTLIGHVLCSQIEKLVFPV